MQEGLPVTNIFGAHEGFSHTSEVEVSPRRVKGEENVTFLSQAGQLKQPIYKTPKGQADFEFLISVDKHPQDLPVCFGDH